MKTLVEAKLNDYQFAEYLRSRDPNWTWDGQTYPNSRLGINTFYNSKGDVIAKAIYDNARCTFIPLIEEGYQP